MAEKKRLDSLLVEKGFCPSREKAKATIMSGVVYVNNQKADKPGLNCLSTDQIDVRGALKYVSRGGLKLEKALDAFPVALHGKTALDVGASTGGFTDCMLQNGAAKVYAIDVGYGQLAWKLRTDPRVVCLERTNIRYVTPEQIGQKVDFAAVDVSFISLKLVLPVAATLLGDSGEVIALVKPQFEAGRGKVGKKGVVREQAVHAEVLHTVCAFAQSAGFGVQGLTHSPVKGPEGNIEFLLYLIKGKESVSIDIDAVVGQAHEEMG